MSDSRPGHGAALTDGFDQPPPYLPTRSQLGETYRFELELAVFRRAARPWAIAAARTRMAHHFALVDLFGHAPSDQEMRQEFFDSGQY